MHDEIMGRTSIWDLDLWPRDMSLHTTYCLIAIIISAKLFLIPTMHDEIMVWTRFWNAQILSADCDLDL